MFPPFTYFCEELEYGSFMENYTCHIMPRASFCGLKRAFSRRVTSRNSTFELASTPYHSISRPSEHLTTF